MLYDLTDEEVLNRLTSTLGVDAWKLTPATFLSYVTQGKWIATPHLLHISSAIASVVARGEGRIIVSLPPRHGKSELLSVGTPQWFLENYPNKRVILTSHTAELSSDFSRRVRDELNMRRDLLTVRLRKDASKMSHFITTLGGSLFSAGVGGPITGRGADLLIVDDYIKTAEEAESPTIRNKINDWFRTVALTRLEPGGTAIILATRWHKHDLIGSLLGEQDPDKKSFGFESIDLLDEEDKELLHKDFEGEEWQYIELPAFPYSSQNDPLGRKEEEALWEERYPAPYLKKRRTTLGPYFWQALYQQRPITRSEWSFNRNLINWIDIAPSHPSMRWVRAWDMSSAETEDADFTVGLLMGLDLRDNKIYICDIQRGQWTPKKVEDIIVKTANLDGSDVEIVLEQEPGSAGKTVAEKYKRDILGGYYVHVERPTGPKHIRANLFYAASEAGRIHLLRDSPNNRWNVNLLEELEEFPKSLHDDQVDTCAYAFNRLCGVRPLSPVIVNRKRENVHYIDKRPGDAVVLGAIWGR